MAVSVGAFLVATVLAIIAAWGGAEVIHALGDGEIDADLVTVLVVAWVVACAFAWGAFVLGRWNPTRR